MKLPPYVSHTVLYITTKKQYCTVLYTGVDQVAELDSALQVYFVVFIDWTHFVTEARAKTKSTKLGTQIFTFPPIFHHKSITYFIKIWEKYDSGSELELPFHNFRRFATSVVHHAS